MGSFTNTYKQYGPATVESGWNTALSFIFTTACQVILTAALLIHK